MDTPEQEPFPRLTYGKTRSVLSLTRGTSRSAGVDFYVPIFTEDFIKDFLDKNPTYPYNDRMLLHEENKMIVRPSERVLIPSGIKVNVPTGYALIAFNKSGVSTKKGLDILAAVIDEDYQGEVHISLVNTSSVPAYILESEKIIQFILIPVLYAPIVQVSIEELYPQVSTRGEGGFGSTNIQEGKTMSQRKDLSGNIPERPNFPVTQISKV